MTSIENEYALHKENIPKIGLQTPDLEYYSMMGEIYSRREGLKNAQ